MFSAKRKTQAARYTARVIPANARGRDLENGGGGGSLVLFSVITRTTKIERRNTWALVGVVYVSSALPTHP